MKAKKFSLKENRVSNSVNDLESNTCQRIALDTIFEDPTEQTNETTNRTIAIIEIESEKKAKKAQTKLEALETSLSDSNSRFCTSCSVGNNSLPNIEV